MFGLFNSGARVEVKLSVNGTQFVETVFTDDPFHAEDIALARNPGASVLFTNVVMS